VYVKRYAASGFVQRSPARYTNDSRYDTNQAEEAHSRRIQQSGVQNGKTALFTISLRYSGRKRCLPALGRLHFTAHQSDSVKPENTGLAMRKLRSSHQVKPGPHNDALSTLLSQGILHEDHGGGSPELSEAV
jgi:hypothetical protein